jgi:hypothetical protein
LQILGFFNWGTGANCPLCPPLWEAQIIVYRDMMMSGNPTDFKAR